MKSLKKFFALALALALCFAMAVPALAANNEFTLSMTSVTPGHAYAVYQIFTGDVYTDTATNELGLTDVKYGQNYTGENGTVGQSVSKSVLDGITDAEQFAREIKEKLIGQPCATLGHIQGAEDATLSTKVPGGYYLIVDLGIWDEKTESYVKPQGEDTINSAYMVEILGDTPITPKTTVPTLDKTVQQQDGTWSEETPDTATNEIGKTFQYKLTANVTTAELAQYIKGIGHYRLTFRDNMSDGITFDGIDSVVISGQMMNADKEMEDWTQTLEQKSDGATGYVLEKGDHNFTLTIENLFSYIGTDAAKWSETYQVVVTYNVHLNENAIVTSGDANGNKNNATLKYSNDPYQNTEGETKPDETTVFSFTIDGTKYQNEYDPENPGDNLLGGAGFSLYPKNEDGSWSEKPLKFKAVTKSVTTGEGEEAVTTTYTDYVLDNTSGEAIVSSNDTTGKFFFSGLGVGEYKLVEEVVPSGFNKCADRIISISASHSETQDKVPVPSLNLTITQALADDNGVASDIDSVQGNTGNKLIIINKSGSLLPSTGGIGTTIFYAVGGALVVGAGVLLFVRKRIKG